MNNDLKTFLISIASSIFVLLLTSLCVWMHIKYISNIKKINNSKKVTETKDLLNRKELSKYYYENIMRLNKKEFSRFAIKGGYGFGKSYVAKEIVQAAKGDNTIPILFSAWEQDEYYSPIDRLLINIYNESEKIGLSKSQKKNLKKLIQKDPKMINIPFDKYIRKYEFFEDIMTSIRPKDKKVIIIIDELDRCTGNDAIEFLEITNQMFANNNDVVLLYLYDFDVLKEIVKHNAGITHEKYINKFIDFSFELSNASYEYFSQRLKEPNFSSMKGLDKCISSELFRASLREVDLFFTWCEFALLKLDNKILKTVFIVEKMLQDLSTFNNDTIWKEVVNNYLRMQLPNEYECMDWTKSTFYNSLEYKNEPWTKDSFKEIENKLMSKKYAGEKLSFNLQPHSILEEARDSKKFEVQYGNIHSDVIALLKIDSSNKRNFIPFKKYNELNKKLNLVNSIDVTHNSYPNHVKEDVTTWNKCIFDKKNIPEWATLTKIFLTKLVTSVDEEFHDYSSFFL